MELVCIANLNELLVEIFKDGDLTSPKLRITGPRLIKLAEKVLNFLIDFQVSFRHFMKDFFIRCWAYPQENSSYEEVADRAYLMIVQLAHDMWIFPDDSEEHIRYMDAIERYARNRLDFVRNSLSQVLRRILDELSSNEGTRNDSKLWSIQESKEEIETNSTKLQVIYSSSLSG